uniref:Uncharacterized protein n=2 Tax=Emiliania huxleyi TaxID=2903 RepID=A0A0D3K4B8_EMIH1
GFSLQIYGITDLRIDPPPSPSRGPAVRPIYESSWCRKLMPNVFPAEGVLVLSRAS